MTIAADPSQVCILWHAAERPPNESLVRALSKRGFSVMPTTSGHTALAVGSRCAKSAKRVVLVLDGQELPQLDRVLDALDRFVPSLICWQHRPGANPPMVPIVRNKAATQGTPKEGAPKEGTPNKPSTTTMRSAGQTPLRLVGKNDGNPSAGGKSGSINARDVLDADELEALLAGELGEGRRGK